jgi:type I restriction enzyme, S subunit
VSGWLTVALGSVAAVFNGKTPSKADQRSSGHRVLKIRDVDEFGQWRGSHESYVERSFANKYPKKLVQAGDCMVLNAAHSSSHVASKTFRARHDTAGALATGEWLVIRPLSGIVDAGFIHHWINSPRTRTLLREAVKGIHLYPRDVARLPLPLPPTDCVSGSASDPTSAAQLMIWGAARL